MSARVLVDGVADASVAALDRGLLYGDGLFETVLFVDGHAPLWARHMTRLTDGCARLALPMPDPALLAAEAARVIEARGRSVALAGWWDDHQPLPVWPRLGAQLLAVLGFSLALFATGLPAWWLPLLLGASAWAPSRALAR